MIYLFPAFLDVFCRFRGFVPTETTNAVSMLVRSHMVVIDESTGVYMMALSIGKLVRFAEKNKNRFVKYLVNAL